MLNLKQQNLASHNMKRRMQFIIISGRSGSGKTTALQALEDLGFYCVDNLPLTLLPSLAEQIQQESNPVDKIAVGIDARNLANQLKDFPRIYQQLLDLKLDCKVIYLDSNDEILLRRFNASRRKHPLSNEIVSLKEAIVQEDKLLQPIASLADLSLDTSSLTIHQLRESIKQYIHQNRSQQISILIQSFSYKHGIPIDADLVFDVRCLNNPHWQAELKELTGLDKPVQTFLENDSLSTEMIEDIQEYLLKWIPQFENNNRSYLTIAIGCTGGQHRSVFVSEKLAEHLKKRFSKIQTRHREISHLQNI